MVRWIKKIKPTIFRTFTQFPSTQGNIFLSLFYGFLDVVNEPYHLLKYVSVLIGGKTLLDEKYLVVFLLFLVVGFPLFRSGCYFFFVGLCNIPLVSLYWHWEPLLRTFHLLPRRQKPTSVVFVVFGWQSQSAANNGEGFILFHVSRLDYVGGCLPLKSTEEEEEEERNEYLLSCRRKSRQSIKFFWGFHTGGCERDIAGLPLSIEMSRPYTTLNGMRWGWNRRKRRGPRGSGRHWKKKKFTEAYTGCSNNQQ